jgi:hypothetical protein
VVAPASGANILTGRVRDARDLGARVQVNVEVGDATVTLVTRPDALRALLPGADVHIRLPADALWAMPAVASQADRDLGLWEDELRAGAPGPRREP